MVSRDINNSTCGAPGREWNTTADFHSHSTDSSDLMLTWSVFHLVVRTFRSFTVDLFTTSWNAQLLQFFSWKLDPEAAAVDAVANRSHPLYIPSICASGSMSSETAEREVGVCNHNRSSVEGQHWFPVHYWIYHSSTRPPSEQSIGTTSSNSEQPGRLACIWHSL